MPRFIVRFLKEILGENGRMSEVCQTTVELEAQARATRNGRPS
jgi:hypothetical protein